MYDTRMHARLYALMQKFEQSGKAGGMPRIMKRLADQLNRSCGLLAADNPLDQRCLLDYAALRAAATEPSDWRKSMLGYASATPPPLLAVGEWFAALRVGQPTPVASGVPTPNPPEPRDRSNRARQLRRQLAATPAALPHPRPPTRAARAAQRSGHRRQQTAEVARPAPSPPPEVPSSLNPADYAAKPVNTAVKQRRHRPRQAPQSMPAGVSQACGASASATPGPFVVYLQIYDDSQRAMAIA